MAFSGITYDGPSNTITATGGTEVSPGRLEEVYQESVSQGWGVVAKVELSSGKVVLYRFTANLQLGDGVVATWLKTGISGDPYIFNHVWFEDGTAFLVKSNAHWIWGAEYYGTQGYGGVLVLDSMPPATAVLVLEAGGELEFHDVEVFSVGTSYGWPYFDDAPELYGLNWFTTTRAPRFAIGGATIDNCNLYGSTFIGSADYDIDGLVAAAISTVAYQGNITFRNTYIGNYLTSQSGTYTHMINCLFGPTFYVTVGAGTATRNTEVYEDYTFDLTVIDQAGVEIEGAAVVLKNKDGDTVYSGSTDEDGRIPQQQVSKHAWKRAQTGDPWEEEYGPFTLTVQAGGYVPVAIELPFDRQHDEVIALVPLALGCIQAAGTIEVLALGGTIDVLKLQGELP